MEFDRLIQHLTPANREIFEQAVATASSRSHFVVNIEHWLQAALEREEPEFISIIRHFELSTERLQASLHIALEALRTGNGGFPKIGTDIARLLFEAWMIASSQFGSLEVRPGHLLLALIENDVLRLRAIKLAPELEKVHGAALREHCPGLLEGQYSGRTQAAEAGSNARASALGQFTIDLTEQARQGKIDKILGRDKEIRQMIDILCRRRQNNPILTGEAGVGKTAVVEGLAKRIVDGDVPESLREVALLTLDMGLLQAGAGVKGEFENRLKNVIKEVQQSPRPIILFIDEAHALIGAGNQSGAGDAANLLKPALARGELRTIAATTWAEYKKYFETDAALTRRFQVVKVEEPSEAQAIVMLRSLSDALEEHHGVTILDEAVTAAVKLSHRYIAGRQLPDKCVSLLDTACARVSLSLHTTPPPLENTRRSLENLAVELGRLEREQHQGHDREQAIIALQAQRAALEAEREAFEQRWQLEKELVARITELRRSLAKPTPENAEYNREALKRELQEARAQLERQDGGSLLAECVNAEVVAEVVADWTGIPVGRMKVDEIDSVLSLDEKLRERVIGQQHALALIAQSMRTARAGLGDPRRPLGVFMLVGPSGTGKTETALALAEQLYGSDRAITVINMSEFKEEHKVSLLMGSPPGYVGYGEGGLLTEAVRRKPYSVVLLDEIEKAHPGVQDIFYQVFDKGSLRDGQGRDIDFKNTVIIMTSNTASAQIEHLCADPDTRPDSPALLEAIAPALRETYKPAFLGRINVIPYYPLQEDDLARIAQMQLNSIRQRVETAYNASLEYSETVVKHIASQCCQSDAGARQVQAILSNTLLPTLSEAVLNHVAKDKELSHIRVSFNKGRFSIKISERDSPPKARGRKRQKAALEVSG